MKKLNPDKLVIVVFLPALVGVMASSYFSQEDSDSKALIPLAIGVWLAVSGMILYTTLITNSVTKTPVPSGLMCASIIALLAYLGFTFSSEPLKGFLFLLLYLTLEMLRALRISVNMLKAENKSQGFLEMIFLTGIILIPLVGVWSLQNRVNNLKQTAFTNLSS